MLRRLLALALAASCVLASNRFLRADITVAAAVSLKAPLEKAQAQFQLVAGEPIIFNFGASGTLASQIRQAAPIDLFISADRANVDKLVDAKIADKTTITVVAGNQLVLVVPAVTKHLQAVPKGFEDLQVVEKLALGEPKVVPAGAYAKEVLTHLKLWDPLDKAGKIVTGENVAAVLTYVERGEVDAGIVYATDAKASKSVTLLATADPAWHSPIEYVSVIIADSKHRDAALKAQQALTTDPIQKIFREAGFITPSSTSPATQPQKK